MKNLGASIQIVVILAMACGQAVGSDCGGLTLWPGQENYRPEWQKVLDEYSQSCDIVPGVTPCNLFAARAIERIYGIHDFDKPGGSIMSANEIADFLLISEKWMLLGEANDQAVLTQAQQRANENKAVVAVFRGTPHGHVAIILPGTLLPSGSWNLRVPNSASFFLGQARKGYIGNKLSCAFSAPSNVQVYGRNY